VVLKYLIIKSNIIKTENLLITTYPLHKITGLASKITVEQIRRQLYTVAFISNAFFNPNGS